LAAGVAHEINNPLAGIRNAFELIKSDLSRDHEHYELLELIDREIERISTITHQMYQLYRRNPQSPNAFVMERAVCDVTSLLSGVAQKQGVRIETQLEQENQVLLPEGEVKQILYNLIRNAVQASLPQKTVHVNVVRDKDTVQVVVSDQGAGISKDILPFIFDPFFTTKTGGPKSGMGLGLSVSRNLIEAMGGSILVETNLSQGSQFTAIFPLQIEPTTKDPDE
jgi:signal transduction histidine kinase